MEKFIEIKGMKFPLVWNEEAGAYRIDRSTYKGTLIESPEELQEILDKMKEKGINSNWEAPSGEVFNLNKDEDFYNAVIENYKKLHK